MKYLLVFTGLLLSFTTFAQIPNGDFENWTLSANNIWEPDGWSTGNNWSAYKFNYLTVERTSDAHSGNWALKIKPYIRDSSYVFNVISGISLGPFGIMIDTAHSCKPSAESNSINYVFKKLTGYYKCHKDSTFEEKVMMAINYYTVNNYGFAVAGKSDFSYCDTFQYFEMPIIYYDTAHISAYPPSTFNFYIWYFSKNASHNPNSYIIFDDLQTSGSYTNVLDVPLSQYVTMYPNPATDAIHIKTMNGTTIRAYSIYDLSGKLLQSSLYKNEPISIQKLSAGNYILQLATSKGIGSLKFEKQ